MSKNCWYLEVRTKGDGDFAYFAHNEPCEECGYDPMLDSRGLSKTQKHADHLNGWVVKITEEIVQ